MTEQRYLLAVAHQHGRDQRIVKGKDGARDFFTEAELEKAAWSLLDRDTRPEIGLFHMDGTVGHAQVVESYIWRGPEWTMTAVDGSQQVVKAGDWLLGLLCDEVAWDFYKSGLVGGVSLQGRGRRRKAAS